VVFTFKLERPDGTPDEPPMREPRCRFLETRLGEDEQVLVVERTGSG
jgi:hypothetical protein